MTRSYASALVVLTATLLIAVLALPACDSNNPGGDDDGGTVVSEDIGPDGGSITSGDGTLTLTIPAGALGNTETITIEEVAEDELSAEFDEIADVLDLQHAYNLGPDGLDFQQPITARFTSDQPPVHTADSLGVLGEFLFTSANGTLEALDSLRTIFDTDDGSVTVSGQTDHFTPVVNGSGVQTNNGVQFFVNNIPEMLEVDDSFDANAVIADANTGPQGDVVTVLEPATYEDVTEVSAPLQPTFEGAPTAEIPPVENLPGSFEGDFSYTCTDTGLGLYRGEMRVPVQFDLDSGTITAESSAEFTATVDCVEATDTLRVAIEGEGTVTSTPAGIDCPEDCTEPFERGTAVTLTAEPADGSEFVKWGGEAPDDCNEDPATECSLTLTPDANDVTATFAPVDDSTPNITDFGGEVVDPETLRLRVRVEWGLQDLSILDATIDPDDGTGAQPVELEATDEEDVYEGQLEYQYAEDIDYPVMPEAGAENTDTGESDNDSFELEKLTITLEKEGEGDGTVIGELVTGLGVSHKFTCGPGCDMDSGQGWYSPDPERILINNFRLTAEPDGDSDFAGWGGDIENSQDCLVEKENCISVIVDMDRTVTATFVPEDDDDVLEEGTKEGPVTISSLEGLFSFLFGGVDNAPQRSPFAHGFKQDEVQFGTLTGTFITGFSGAEGFTVVDLLTGEELLSDTGLNSDIGNAFGVIGLTETPPGPDSPATIFVFAQNGVAFFDTQGEGSTTPGVSTFDGWPAGGDARSGWATAVQPDVGVRFIAFDEAEGLHTFTDETIPADQFDDQVVSAYLPASDGSPGDNPILALDRAVESGLYLVQRDGSAPQRVADVGLDARKIRCVDPDGGDLVCGITVFGDDEVAIVTWDGQNTPTVEGTVPAGDGPVDLGLTLLDNGNVGLVTTGFNDDTVTEVELSPDGSVVQSDTRPVLDGCQSPGHAIYVRDDAGLKVVGTCFDSDNYFIDASEL